MDVKKNPGTVLVVDDSPTNIKLMLDHLSGHGFKVLIAQDGASAIEQAQLARPDLILLDVMMPGMDGFETCEKLKREDEIKDIPVIFLTAISESVHKVQGFAAGAVDYVTKPFNFEEVLARVNTQITISKLQKNLQENNTQLNREITERKELEKKLRNTQAHLVQSEKMAALGKLVAGIAHEINTPIGAIHSMNNTLELAVKKLRANLDPTVLNGQNHKIKNTLKILDDVVNVFSTASRRVNEIVYGLRSFARLDEADLKRVDIREGIDETLKLLNPKIKNRIKIVKDYGELSSFVCFPGRLNQVFLNLLVNACDAIQDNGEIDIAAFEKDRKAHVIVRDTGAGILPEDLSKVFDPGFTTKGVGVGTGLGLSICYQIVQEHRGEIRVESEPQKGTTFTVILPMDLEKQLANSEIRAIR